MSTVASRDIHFKLILCVCCVTLKCQQTCFDVVDGPLTLNTQGPVEDLIQPC